MRFFAAMMLGALLTDIWAVRAASQTAPSSARHLNFSLLHPTFSENFARFEASDTGLLNGKPVWRTTYNNGVRTLANNHETEYYANDGAGGPFRVVDNTLEITAEPAPNLPDGLTYVSGVITSEESFRQLYGYFEIRAELPGGRGWWPAFWLLPADGSWPPEIDAMEMLGDDPTRYYASIHAITGTQHIDDVTGLSAPDLTKGFHRFGVAWRPDHIDYYLDGDLVHEVATPADMNRPMYLLVNLAVGGAGSWPGAVTPNSTGTYRIAWIRAWQFNDLGRQKQHQTGLVGRPRA